MNDWTAPIVHSFIEKLKSGAPIVHPFIQKVKNGDPIIEKVKLPL